MGAEDRNIEVNNFGNFWKQKRVVAEAANTSEIVAKTTQHFEASASAQSE